MLMICRRCCLSFSSNVNITLGPMLRWIEIRKNYCSSSIDCEAIALVIFCMLVILFCFTISRNTARWQWSHAIAVIEIVGECTQYWREGWWSQCLGVNLAGSSVSKKQWRCGGGDAKIAWRTQACDGRYEWNNICSDMVRTTVKNRSVYLMLFVNRFVVKVVSMHHPQLLLSLFNVIKDNECL